MEISASPWRLEPMSATFHGRDLFAPVAARLAAGAPLAEAGQPLDPDQLVALARSEPRTEQDGTLVAHAVLSDGYGNVQLDAGHAGTGLRLGHAARIDLGDRVVDVPFARTFADVAAGEALVYEDPSGMLALAVNGGDAAAVFALRPGDEVRIRPA